MDSFKYKRDKLPRFGGHSTPEGWFEGCGFSKVDGFRWGGRYWVNSKKCSYSGVWVRYKLGMLVLQKTDSSATTWGKEMGAFR